MYFEVDFVYDNKSLHVNSSMMKGSYDNILW